MESIIDALKGIKGIGTVTGFITNGPELVCLTVGLFTGDIIFSASTPLGSNFLNPILLIAASLAYREFIKVLTTEKSYSLSCIFLTSGMAISFYMLPSDKTLFYWLILTVLISIILFIKRPKEFLEPTDKETQINKLSLIGNIVVLIPAGYFLDPFINFASLQSNASKGVIGFFILALLSSWPEFKTCLVFIKKKQHLSAVLNVTVSNITNLWLTIVGTAIYLLIF